MLWHPIYLALGIIEDFLIAKYYLCLARQRAFLASAYAMIITAFGLGVVSSIIISRRFLSLAFYALGNGIGTFFAIRRRK